MKRFLALTCVCLASLTAGCANTKPVTVTEYRYLDLPDRFLVECQISDWSAFSGTFRDLGKLAAARRVDLEICNEQLREARDFQAAERAKSTVTH